MKFSKLLIDTILFISLGIICLILALHGKNISGVILGYDDLPIRIGSTGMFVYPIVSISILGFQLLRIFLKRLRLVLFLCAFIGISSTLLLNLAIETPSSLIFFLIIYIYAVCSLIVVLEKSLKLYADFEFWKFLLQLELKAIQFILVLFGVGIAILRFVSTSVNEGASGFLTTAFYPAFIMIVTFFMAAYWIILPTWEKLIEHRNKDQKNKPKSRYSRSMSFPA